MRSCILSLKNSRIQHKTKLHYEKEKIRSSSFICEATNEPIKSFLLKKQ